MLLIFISTSKGHTPIGKHLYCSKNSSFVSIHSVIIRRNQHINTRLKQSVNQRIGGAKLRISFVGGSCKGYLEICNGKVGQTE